MMHVATAGQRPILHNTSKKKLCNSAELEWEIFVASVI